MENKPQFIKELHDLLEKYNVEISIGLDGDTHGLDSWISITHRPDPKSFKDIEILKLNDLSHHDLKPYLSSQPQPSASEAFDRFAWDAQYRVLSELYEHKSKHHTHLKIGKMMDDILTKIETYKNKFGGMNK